MVSALGLLGLSGCRCGKMTSYMIPEGSSLELYLSKLCDGSHQHAKVQRTIARDAGEYTMSLSRAVVAGAVHDAAFSSQWMSRYTRGLKLSNETAMQRYDTEEVAKTFSLVPERIQVFAGWANKSLLPNVPGQFVRRLLCVYDDCGKLVSFADQWHAKANKSGLQLGEVLQETDRVLMIGILPEFNSSQEAFAVRHDLLYQ